MTATLLDRSKQRLAELEGRLDTASEPLERVRLELATGRHDTAHQAVDDLLAGDLEARILAARILFAVADTERLRPIAEGLAGEGQQRLAIRRLVDRWRFLTEDLERFEGELAARRRFGEPSADDHLSTGRLASKLLDWPAAEAAYDAALEAARGAGDGNTGDGDVAARALHGQALVRYDRRKFPAALDLVNRALDLAPLDPDLLTFLAHVLIRLGRTAEAIDSLELAIRLAPWHERAHYLLGNGYARRTYRELEAVDPAAFAAARDLVHRGSEAWEAGSLQAARRHFRAALDRCPGHGRAHNGLARTLESERLLLSVHHAGAEARFAARDLPEVPEIERFIVNWRDLTPRHQKRVALSIAPWRRFVSALLESGATYTIKLLHERLSEVPRQELLRDRRIDYDARLWDDVRGCGGHHTVTGVEDVEQTIHDAYDTVLHELTHQVHQLLPPEPKRRIQELYRRTKARDAATGEAFLSRYAGESVWEYFAEGANSLASPRRDAYDGREIVRERLDARDPELRRLVEELMHELDLAPVRARATVRRGDDLLRHGRADEAIDAYRRAITSAPDDEEVLGSLASAETVAGRPERALELTAEGLRRHPESAILMLHHAEALWLTGHGLDAAIGALEPARAAVRDDERHRLDLRLGFYRFTAGDAAAARASFNAVLDYQADHPSGLWGLASARALEESWDDAWTHYEAAVQQRSGLAELRAEYARDLLRAGELGHARVELDAALLLDAEEPEALAADAWWHLEAGEPEHAATIAHYALALAPWCDAARIVAAATARRLGDDPSAEKLLAPLTPENGHRRTPRYFYRPSAGRYVLGQTLAAVWRGVEARQAARSSNSVNTP